LLRASAERAVRAEQDEWANDARISAFIAEPDGGAIGMIWPSRRLARTSDPGRGDVFFERRFQSRGASPSLGQPLNHLRTVRWKYLQRRGD